MSQQFSIIKLPYLNPKALTLDMDVAGLKYDSNGNARSPYSLRHFALQSRLRNSKGKVNIYWLAKNAGTSVEQLERFYLKNMELSAEQVENLQTLGDEV